MDQDQQKIIALPWLQALLIELSTQHFLADDQDFDAELTLAEACETCAEPPSYNPDDLEDETDFPLELSKLVNERWRGTKRQFCEEALLLENTFYKIQAGKRIPGRDTAICLALALKLSDYYSIEDLNKMEALN